ncbi:MAG: protein kinase [Pirellulaceae bacterium]|nr:protein kinase [Pirellulaceae bacterium]
MSGDSHLDRAETATRGAGSGVPHAAPGSGPPGASPPAPESADEVGGGSASRGPAASLPGEKTVISKRPPVSGPAFRRAANPFEMGATLTGDQLGHFQLEEFIGGGGMGAVFRATDLMLGRTVAVKVVSRDETNEDTLRRFRNEAQSAARLDHPNIARVYYVGEDQGWNYIVFEYIEGVNVRDLVEHGGVLALEDAIKYCVQIAEALDHAARRDVTHRDIKPSNILIMADGRAKLVDMGLARLHQVESSAEDLTASGVTLGTFDYISPEQARDPRNTDVRSDLYSLGCTLYYMLAGQPPFPEGTVLQKLLSHSSDEPPDISRFRPDLPGEIVQVVKRLLAKLPEHRYQSPGELIAELLRLSDRLGLTSVTTSATYWPAPSVAPAAWWVRHLPWLVPSVLLTVVVLVQTWLDLAGDAAIPPPPRLAQGPSSSGPGPVTQPDAGQSASGAASATDSGATQAPPRSEAAPAEGRAPSDTVTPPAAAEAPDQANGAPRVDGVTSPPEASPPAAPVDGPRSDGSLAVREEPPRSGPPSGTETPSGGPPASAAERAGRAAADLPGATPWGDPQILVVSDEDVRLDRSMLCVRSLPEALERAATLRGVREIQLRFNGLRMLPPLVLDLHWIGQQQLTIRAADGFSPIVAFEGNGDRAAGNGPTAMMQLRHGRLTWRGTHFFVQLPPNADDLAARALFELESVEALEFQGCSFTVRNVSADGLPAARRVSCLHVLPPAAAGDPPSAGQEPRAQPEIRLRDCVARGQASLVRSDQAAPFRLTWEHGLFISSEELVELGASTPAPAAGRIALDFARLLAFADRGICLARSDSALPDHVGLTVRAQACLFATRLTRPPTALYLFRGVNPLAGDRPLVEINGSNNFYKNTKVVLRVESQDSRQTLSEFTFDDLKEYAGQVWYNERSPLAATVFSWLPPPHSADRQKLEDFITPGSDGWLMGDLDIAPAEWPRFPDYSSLLPRADLRLPPALGTGIRGS